MKLSIGRHYLAIPGPSVIPDRVLNAMHRASPDIYAGELPEMVPGLYRDLRAMARTSHHVAVYIVQLFCGTAPTHHLFGLRAALDMILHEEGLEAVWRRHDVAAHAVWAAFGKWGAAAGQGSGIALNIADPAIRSRAVTTARLASPFATKLREWVEAHAGVTLGLGIGMAPPGDPASHGFLRIAHMGHFNAHMTLGVLASMEAGMKALGIAHGDDALSAAAAVLTDRRVESMPPEVTT